MGLGFIAVQLATKQQDILWGEDDAAKEHFLVPGLMGHCFFRGFMLSGSKSSSLSTNVMLSSYSSLSSRINS